MDLIWEKTLWATLSVRKELIVWLITDRPFWYRAKVSGKTFRKGCMYADHLVGIERNN